MSANDSITATNTAQASVVHDFAKAVLSRTTLAAEELDEASKAIPEFAVSYFFWKN